MSILRTDEFLAALKAVKFQDKEQYRKTINTLCKQEIEYLRCHVELTTLRRYCTDLRNTVRRAYDGRELPISYKDVKNHSKMTHIAVKYLVLLRAETQEYANSEIARKSTFLDPEKGSPIQIVQPDEMVNTALSMLDSSSVYELGVGLLLLTGRRCIEIMKTGYFEPSDENENRVIFHGQAKTRGSKNAHNGYTIPVLGSSAKIITALSQIRAKKDFSQDTERAVNNKTSTMLGRMTKRHFAKFVPGHDIEAKDLRSIYVHIAFSHFDYSQRTTINEFASVMLGHVNFSTSRNYMMFRL